MSSGKDGARMGCRFSYGSRRAPIVWRGAPGSGPRTVATWAIEIDAPPSPIWPWLVQMGPGRVGAYPYDWIENLFGLNTLSADRIVRSGSSSSGRCQGRLKVDPVAPVEN